MKFYKRILSCICALSLAFTFISADAMALNLETDGDVRRFVATRTYKEGQFNDVPADAWCAANVKELYELGIMGGKSETHFDATGNITIAQTVVMAVRIFCIYYDLDEPSGNTSPWYANHLELAEKYNIVTKQYDNYNVPITRAEFAQILRNVYPDGPLQKINYVQDNAIPDVPMDAENAEAIYKLYRAGVLTGSDDKGTFYPETYITRGAAAAIASRLVKHRLRQSLVLAEKSVLLYAEQSTIAVGEETMVVSRVVPSTKQYEPAAFYTSTNPEVATVTSCGLVTGITEGKTTIIATASDGTQETVEIIVDPNYTPATWYHEGKWIVGSDIPAGTYFLTSTDYTENRSALCEVYKNADTTKKENKISGYGFSYFQNFCVVEVKKGQCLFLEKDVKAIAIENAPNLGPNSDGYYWPGYYLVGTTLPAGTYQFFQQETGVQGFYSVEPNINCGLLDTVENGFFSFSIEKQASVKNGQILGVSRGYFKAVE